MRSIPALILALALWAAPAGAEDSLSSRTARGDEFTITLTKEPCQLDMTGVSDEDRAKIFAAKILFKGGIIRACYLDEDGVVYGVDEYGSMFTYERSRFRDTSI